MKHIMHDLETLSLRPDAVIVSIGAVIVTPDGLGPTFYQAIDLNQPGRHIECATLKWWMQQPDEARKVFWDPQASSLYAALRLYNEFFRDHQIDGGVWSNGADFDNVILTSAYRYVEMDMPWRYTQSRCFRTLKNLYNIQRDFTGTKHNALDDANLQALVLKDILDLAGLW